MPTGREIFFRVRFIYSCKFKIRLAFQPVISEICKVLPISNVSNMNSSIRKCTLVVQALFGFCIIRCVSLLFVIVTSWPALAYQHRVSEPVQATDQTKEMFIVLVRCFYLYEETEICCKSVSINKRTCAAYQESVNPLSKRKFGNVKSNCDFLLMVLGFKCPWHVQSPRFVAPF